VTPISEGAMLPRAARPPLRCRASIGKAASPSPSFFAHQLKRLHRRDANGLAVPRLALDGQTECRGLGRALGLIPIAFQSQGKASRSLKQVICRISPLLDLLLRAKHLFVAANVALSGSPKGRARGRLALLKAEVDRLRALVQELKAALEAARAAE
jgi:hypothetical protein